jgi:hypothetical protein
MASNPVDVNDVVHNRDPFVQHNISNYKIEKEYKTIRKIPSCFC